MSFNAAAINTYYEKTFTLDTGVATRVWTFQSPTWPVTILALEYATDACDSTDKATVVLAVNTDTRITGTAQSTPDAVLRFTTADSTKSLVVPADASCTLTVTCAGTAANVRGLVVTVKLSGAALYPAGS